MYGGAPINTRWWMAPEADPYTVANLLNATVNLVKESQKGATLEDMIHARMYGGRRAISGTAFASASIDAVQAGGVSTYGQVTQPNYNLVYSVVNTIVSRMIKAKPRVEVITEGGNYRQQYEADKLTTFLDGCIYETEGYKHAEQALRNACILGTGFLKVWVEEDKLCVASVFPSNIRVDTIEGDAGNPRSLFQDGLVDRFGLAERFKGDKALYEKILMAKAFVPSGGMASVTGGDLNALNNMLLINEGWHLPSGEDAGDGRHVMTIANSGVCLLDEKWEHECFPFAVIRFDQAPLGYFGRGVAELLTGHQLQLSRTLETEALAHNLYSVPVSWINRASNVNPVHLQTNYPGVIFEYDGDPNAIKEGMPPAVSVDFIAYRDWIINSAMEFLGLSQIQSQGTPPPGVTAGVALREYDAQVSDRWTSLGYAWEKLFCDLAELFIEFARGNAKSMAVRTPVKGVLKQTKLSEIKLKKGDYVTQAFPASELPREPAARKQYVTELRQSGAIDDDTMLDLLRMPDTKAYLDRRTAGTEHLKKVIYEICDEGKFTPADELDPLAKGIQMFTDAYHWGQDNGVEPERLMMLRNWIAQAKGHLTPTAPPPGAPMAPPLAKGAPPPVSDMLSTGAPAPQPGAPNAG